MRLHKFRAWNDEKKEWMDLRQADLCFIQHKEIEGKWIVIRHETQEVYEDLKIHEYTGLLDCNNQEIIEGDICRAYKEGSGLDGVYEIVWDAQRGKWAYRDHGIIEKYQVGTSGNMHCEVIGNVFENSDLLDH